MNTEDVLFNMVIMGIGRFLDLFSTWYTTPNFDIEANSWMKKVGWKKVILINIALVIVLSVLARERTISIGVFSSIVAARNFQAGTMARAMGEKAYLTTHRRFIKNNSWYFPLLPIFFESLIYIAIGMTITGLIGAPENTGQKYISMIGTALLATGLMLSSLTIALRLEKKYIKGG